jgi:hypothetical protein
VLCEVCWILNVEFGKLERGGSVIGMARRGLALHSCFGLCEYQYPFLCALALMARVRFQLHSYCS